jgi:tRNA (guanine37-N1)-methyltransferase
MANYDLLGNIAIVKFDRDTKLNDKKRIAKQIMNEHKSVKTVLEKIGKFSGRLRTLKTNYILGDKNKEAMYTENGCRFLFNVDSCYFSPRLSTERVNVANMVKKNERVLVMFGGVAPFAIIIAKISRAKEVYSVELSRECNKYAKENVRLNKLVDRVKIVQGDVRKVVPKIEGKFDRIFMTRPQLKDSFLDVAFKKIKKSGIISYYGFYSVEDVEENKELEKLILEKAKESGKKIKIMKIVRAGDIGVRKYRYRADIKVLN